MVAVVFLLSPHFHIASSTSRYSRLSHSSLIHLSYGSFLLVTLQLSLSSRSSHLLVSHNIPGCTILFSFSRFVSPSHQFHVHFILVFLDMDKQIYSSPHFLRLFPPPLCIQVLFHPATPPLLFTSLAHTKFIRVILKRLATTNAEV